MDMAPGMGLAIKNSFPNCSMVIDRFHVVRLVMDAMQHIRVSLRWAAIKAENDAIKQAKGNKEKYLPEVLSNGDTLKQLLARSKYLLYKTEDEWTVNQTRRAGLLFEKYPSLKTAYKFALQFRAIYKNTVKTIALERFQKWKEKVGSRQVFSDRIVFLER